MFKEFTFRATKAPFSPKGGTQLVASKTTYRVWLSTGKFVAADPAPGDAVFKVTTVLTHE